MSSERLNFICKIFFFLLHLCHLVAHIKVDKLLSERLYPYYPLLIIPQAAVLILYQLACNKSLWPCVTFCGFAVRSLLRKPATVHFNCLTHSSGPHGNSKQALGSLSVKCGGHPRERMEGRTVGMRHQSADISPFECL